MKHKSFNCVLEKLTAICFRGFASFFVRLQSNLSSCKYPKINLENWREPKFHSVVANSFFTPQKIFDSNFPIHNSKVFKCNQREYFVLHLSKMAKLLNYSGKIPFVLWTFPHYDDTKEWWWCSLRRIFDQRPFRNGKRFSRASSFVHSKKAQSSRVFFSDDVKRTLLTGKIT